MAEGDPHLKDRLLNDLSSSIDSGQNEPLGETPAAPPTIPDHSLLRRIGKGSYGEVWLARNVMGTFRAIKIVYRRVFDSDRPYEREFTGIRRFEPVSRTHPSQLNVLHVGRDDAAGYFYYVMELADPVTPVFQTADSEDPKNKPEIESPTGTSAIRPETYSPRTLRSELQHRGALPYEECLDIATALATALDHLHRNGLVHRDIKPSNIIFVNGIPKLADIGLVTHVEATLSFVGTEGFIPPEGPGTPQADIYSLGKVLYEMSTGRDRQEFPELPTNLLERPPSERVALEELNEVIVRACQTDPKQRYASAAEMHADLALLQSGESVRRIRSAERRLRFVGRAGALVTAVAVLIGAAFLYQRLATRRAERLASENRVLAEQKAALAETNAQMAAESRRRVVQMDIANGQRLLDSDRDLTGALLWFAHALPLMDPASREAQIHRIRIRNFLTQAPRAAGVLPHDSSVQAAAFSPDGMRVATGTFDQMLTVWDRNSGTPVWGPKKMSGFLYHVRFSRDGKRVFASSSQCDTPFNSNLPKPNFVAVLDAASGEELFPPQAMMRGAETNLVWSAFSPDDRWLALSLEGGTVRVLDLRDGSPVTELQVEPTGEATAVLHLSFSADGSLLSTAGSGVRLWKIPSGEPLRVLPEQTRRTQQAILTDDGRYLLCGYLGPQGSEIQAWEVGTGKRVGEPIKSPTGLVAMFVEPGPARRFFANFPENFTPFRAWDLATGVRVFQDLDAPGAINWTFSADGRQLVFTGFNQMVYTLDPSTGNLKVTNLPQLLLNQTALSPDGQTLLTASADGNVQTWSLRTAPLESVRLQLPTPVPPIRDAGEPVDLETHSISPPGRIALWSGGLQLADPDHLEDMIELAGTDTVQSPGRVLHGHTGQFWAWQPQPDSKDAPVTVTVWREDGGALRRIDLEHPKGLGLGPCAFSRDDHWLMTCGRDRLIRFWRTSDGHLERSVKVPDGKGRVLAMSFEAGVGVWGCDLGDTSRNFVEGFELNSGKVVERPWYSRSNVEIPLAEFSPDGKKLALGASMGSVHILEVPSGRELVSGIKHAPGLDQVEWSPDGGRLLTAGGYSEVLVWDTTTGTQVLDVGLSGGIVKARWSPDGRFILGRNTERQVRVWDAATGRAVTPVLVHEGEIRMAFMTRNNRLVTLSGPDLLRAWDFVETTLSPEVFSDYAKLLAGRCLTQDGMLLTLQPRELAELCRSVRQRAPQLFE